MFKNIITIALLTLTAILSGCSTIDRHEQYGPLTYVHQDKSVDIGSYVQWNEDYAVTAKHVRNVKNVAYVSADYDLVFFEHKSTAPLKWAETKKNEPLTSKGFPFFPSREKEKVIEAKSVDINLTMDDMPDYYLLSAQLVSGMSGGPVFNQFNEVVGINIGYTKRLYNIDNKTQIYSVYLSYQGIQKEWNKFQKVSQH